MYVLRRCLFVEAARFQAVDRRLAARLCREDRLLMTLMYWREYRTRAHVAQTYGLSESAVCCTVHAVEDALLRSSAFILLSRRFLTKSDIRFEVVVVDATGVWHSLKHVELGNVCCHDLPHLWEELTAAEQRLRQKPDIIEAYFRQVGYL